MPQPINSRQKQHVIEISQSAQSIASALSFFVLLVDNGGIKRDALPNFYNSEANERFLSLPEDELTNLSTNQNQDTLQGLKNLAERFQRVEGVA